MAKGNKRSLDTEEVQGINPMSEGWDEGNGGNSGYPTGEDNNNDVTTRDEGERDEDENLPPPEVTDPQEPSEPTTPPSSGEDGTEAGAGGFEIDYTMPYPPFSPAEGIYGKSEEEKFVNTIAEHRLGRLHYLEGELPENAKREDDPTIA